MTRWHNAALAKYSKIHFVTSASLVIDARRRVYDTVGRQCSFSTPLRPAAVCAAGGRGAVPATALDEPPFVEPICT